MISEKASVFDIRHWTELIFIYDFLILSNTFNLVMLESKVLKNPIEKGKKIFFSVTGRCCIHSLSLGFELKTVVS